MLSVMLRRTQSHILITGANGYIGRALSDEAAARAMHVVQCARRPPAAAGWVALPNFDVSSTERLPLDCDAIVHLAGIAHRPPDQQPSETEYFDVNAKGAETLAKAARGRAKVFVLVSTIAALGPGIHQRESTVEPKPVTPYGRSKRAAESMVRDVLSGSTTALRVVRLPAVHGPGAPGAISQLAAWVARGRPIPSGCGVSFRSVIGIDNVADFLLKAMSDTISTDLTLNPSDGPAPSVLDIARRIAVLKNIQLRVIPCPRPVLTIATSIASVAGRPAAGLRQSLNRLLENHVVEDDRALLALGWRPPLTLEEGLKRAFGRNQAPNSHQ
jgi:nucleoside-diphosphate-sugar epimerase